MATREQCEKRLRKRLRTKRDVEEFAAEWGGDIQSPANKEVFVDENIRWIVDSAYRKGLLDQLGMKLGYPSDAESKRLITFWTNFRSWAAIAIAILALAVSAWAFWGKE